ncbi:hypothetical protein C8R44DRAFT_744114 [Mycena epipterygia]|nr:hypothetical protein C8R44DRAFT_744114 [Mycena epipterygia]
MKQFRKGKIEILIVTEAVRMGADIPDIELIIQFGVPSALRGAGKDKPAAPEPESSNPDSGSHSGAEDSPESNAPPGPRLLTQMTGWSGARTYYILSYRAVDSFLGRTAAQAESARWRGDGPKHDAKLTSNALAPHCSGEPSGKLNVKGGLLRIRGPQNVEDGRQRVGRCCNQHNAACSRHTYSFPSLDLRYTPHSCHLPYAAAAANSDTSWLSLPPAFYPPHAASTSLLFTPVAHYSSNTIAHAVTSWLSIPSSAFYAIDTPSTSLFPG